MAYIGAHNLLCSETKSVPHNVGLLGLQETNESTLKSDHFDNVYSQYTGQNTSPSSQS